MPREEDWKKQLEAKIGQPLDELLTAESIAWASKFLDDDDCAILERWMTAAPLHSLTSLDLSDNFVSSRGASSIAAAIAAAPSLKRLDMRRNRFTPDGLAELQEACHPSVELQS
jgi:hypothetical protein